MLKNFNKKYKKLSKKYQQELSSLTKDIFKDNKKGVKSGLDYFVTYLQFLRDYFILTEPLEINGNENLKIVMISTAIQEYQQYLSCEQKYFKVTKNNVEKLIKGTADEVLKKYNDERAFHWNCFWQIISTSMESWVDDSVTI